MAQSACGLILSRQSRNQRGIISSAGAKAVESQMTGLLTERYDDRIAGVLSCYDLAVND